MYSAQDTVADHMRPLRRDIEHLLLSTVKHKAKGSAELKYLQVFDEVVVRLLWLP